MAFLRSYGSKCDKGCGAKASEELLTYRNELYGRYCARHAKQMLTVALAGEAKTFERQARGRAEEPTP